MKNKFIKISLVILTIFTLVSGIGVIAITLVADDIIYSSSHDEWNVDNAQDALDYLYKIGEYEIPSDTYFYNSNTIGKDIVRYKKIDGNYYLCDENGKIINNNKQDVSKITLMEYKGTVSSGISAGKAGYASGQFILGSGEETINYFNENKQTIMHNFSGQNLQIPTVSNGYASHWYAGYVGYDSQTSQSLTFDQFKENGSLNLVATDVDLSLFSKLVVDCFSEVGWNATSTSRRTSIYHIYVTDMNDNLLISSGRTQTKYGSSGNITNIDVSTYNQKAKIYTAFFYWSSTSDYWDTAYIQGLYGTLN